MLGKKTWEEAESELQSRTGGCGSKRRAFQGGEDPVPRLRAIFSPLIATSFGNVNLEIPMFGLYGPSSTMGEGLSGCHVRGGRIRNHVLVSARQPFCLGGKAVPVSVEYGNQRPYSATWTVTEAAGAVILSSGSYRGEEPPLARSRR